MNTNIHLSLTTPKVAECTLATAQAAAQTHEHTNTQLVARPETARGVLAEPQLSTDHTTVTETHLTIQNKFITHIK